MFSAIDNFPALMIWLPLLGATISFLLKKDQQARNWAVVSSVLTLGLTITSLFFTGSSHYLLTQVSYIWLPSLGSSFTLSLDGISWMLCLLTAVSFPLIFISTFDPARTRANAFYGLMLMAQAGLMGVFLATDALTFYFFWELALIPVYFLASMWGGERRIQAAFKFFIYTFVGSLLLLIGILYVYLKTPDQSFSLSAFYQAPLSATEQGWLFWMFFLAFAIKMPIFPFHTWQPDAYEQSDTAVTMVLSAVMVKMGVFALMRWLLPLFPSVLKQYDNIVIGLSVVGVVYASCLAMVQDDLKRLVAYSSIAHIGLMSAAIFTRSMEAWHGATIQMFSHGINILGMWIVVALIERKLGIRKISELGGLARKAPTLAILFLVVAFANVALPLTNAFVGEFLMFAGLFKFNMWYAAVAGLGIILSAVYTLNMIKRVMFGATNGVTETFGETGRPVVIALTIIVLIIFATGVYPEPLFNLIESSSDALLRRILVR
ncbi:MAG: NADH-quinone oxidoreductase subunit M [Chitinophagaceae bacterium]|jgi:NADH-quinone oxidoreductase subunit M|nr:NADH-quinone oxidoreductase subunit M [Chitinophagaceae bacterium]